MRQVLTAEPFKRYLMRLPVHTLQEGEMRLHVRAGDAQDHDALEIPLTISRPRNQALRVAATYGMTTDNEVKESHSFSRQYPPRAQSSQCGRYPYRHWWSGRGVYVYA